MNEPTVGFPRPRESTREMRAVVPGAATPFAPSVAPPPVSQVPATIPPGPPPHAHPQSHAAFGAAPTLPPTQLPSAHPSVPPPPASAQAVAHPAAQVPQSAPTWMASPHPTPPPASPRAIVRPPAPLPGIWTPNGGTPLPTEEPAPAPTPVAAPEPRRREAYEVVWKDGDPEALGRARSWALADHGRPRGLVPRLGRAGLIEPRPRPDGWWLEGKSERVATLLRERSLLDGEGGALACPALVMRGTFALDFALADELSALRAALRHLERRHKAVREALELARDIDGSELTPTAVLRSGIDELLRAAEAAGMRADAVRKTARESLVRNRRYRTLNLLGEDHIVGRWVEEGSSATSQVAYLSSRARSALPLAIAFPARAVITLHPRQDPDEKDRLALVIHALARHLTADELETDATPPPAR
ncbi:MAG: hypothetical protein R3B72_43895 [Polyangiaceae bacterium]